MPKGKGYDYSKRYYGPHANKKGGGKKAGHMAGKKGHSGARKGKYGGASRTKSGHRG